jgi:predicted ATP-dependent endonuclease of OLD family
LTFPLFKNKEEELLVFIEEPEMFMHPGLQRIFLNTLFFFEKHQFFFTTHSNHFLDLTLDYKNISIYAFNKKFDDGSSTSPTFEIYNASNASNRPLELLGVRNSSVLLTNCTIWVEGITDRKYLQHYLEMYQEELPSNGKKIKQLQEDTHYSFVEYGGANITHWSFLDADSSINVDRLCGKLFLITDKDRADDLSKQGRHEKLKTKLDDRYYCLQVREIENLLTPEVLKKTIVEYEKPETSIDAFNQDDYKDEPLGNYIEKTLLKGAKKRLGRYATDSGTISQKIDFCEKAISHIKTFNDISGEAQALTKNIYEFIMKNNS